MDDDSDKRDEWSTPAWLIIFGGALTLGAACWWVLSGALIDRVFVGVLVLVLAFISAYAALLRPRLRADHGGLTVRGFGGTRSWPWPQVHYRVRRDRRFGRTVEVLELEVPERDVTGGLLVLGKFDLGTDPREVADRLEHLRPANH